MSCIFVCLNNWSCLDWRGRTVVKLGYCHRCSGRAKTKTFVWFATIMQKPCTQQNSHFILNPWLLFFHCGYAMVNQELLSLKPPSACLSMACMRLLMKWSGISRESSTSSKCPVARCLWAICSSLPTFTLHLLISILNDELFLNGPWLMMSNPKIPSNAVFVLSHSRATSFHSCLPCFTLTGTACPPPWSQLDWQGADEQRRSLSHNVKKTMCWRRTAKMGRVLSRLVAVPNPLPTTNTTTPLSCSYANSLCWEKTQGMT